MTKMKRCDRCETEAKEVLLNFDWASYSLDDVDATIEDGRTEWATDLAQQLAEQMP